MNVAKTWGGAALAVLLAACGGGGGGGGGLVSVPTVGGTQTLQISFSYPPEAIGLYNEVTVQPRLGGFDGHAPRCSLVSGSLPAGMTLREDCAVTGRPTTEGASTFEVRVGAAGVANTLQYFATLRVQGPGVMYADRSFLQALALGQAVNDLPSVVNWTPPADLQGTWSYRLAGGALPMGITLDPTTGSVSGTAQASGAFSATVQATLTSRFGTFEPVVSTYAVNVNVPFLGYPVDAQPNAIVRTIYISQPVALAPIPIGLYAPGVTFAFSGVTLDGPLPAGLALDAATGVVSGTPPTGPESSVDLNVRATVTTGAGASGPTQGALRLSVASPVRYDYGFSSGAVDIALGAPAVIAPTRVQNSDVALAAGAAVTFARDPVWCNLPAGLALDPATGVVSGTPTAAGQFSCDVVITQTNNGVTWTTGTILMRTVR